MRGWIVLAPLVCACAPSRPAVIPEPRRSFAPAVELSIEVAPSPRLSGYWSRKGLGQNLAEALRAELRTALVRSGFRTSVIEPDLIARITADYSGSLNDLRSTTVIELLHRGRMIDRFEIVTPAADTQLSAEQYPEYVASSVVNWILLSREVAMFAQAKKVEDQTGS